MTSDTRLYGPIARATAASFGIGCGGGAGTPKLASNEPHPGQRAFHLDLLSARPSSPCLIALATGTQQLAFGGGCTLYLKGTLVPLLTASNVSGFATVTIPVPDDIALRGLTLYAQDFVLDPQGGALGLSFSPGRKLVVGD